jgi:arsenical pump membrane protein
MSLLPWLSVAILVATLTLMLIRPRGSMDAWFAARGALAILLIGIVRPVEVGAVIVERLDVLLFLFGMMILTDLAGGAGAFKWPANGAAKLALGSGRLFSSTSSFSTPWSPRSYRRM